MLISMQMFLYIYLIGIGTYYIYLISILYYADSCQHVFYGAIYINVMY